MATLETNFTSLEPYGIFLFAKGTFQINTTGVTKTETITLKGIGDGGADVTRDLRRSGPAASRSSSSARRGSGRPARTTDLIRLQGGFFLGIETAEAFEMTVFATAELSFGVGDAQLTYG